MDRQNNSERNNNRMRTYIINKLDKEDKKTLEKNMSHLKTSAKSNYCLPILQIEKIKLWSIYEKYIYKRSPSMSCPRCVLRVCTALYWLYEDLANPDPKRTV